MEQLTRDKGTPDAHRAPYRPSLIGMPLAAVRRRASAGHAKPIDPRELSLLEPLFKQGVSYPKPVKRIAINMKNSGTPSLPIR